jgi:metal-responsive CopG/Arc/MetJ family transcriptional regulator
MSKAKVIHTELKDLLASRFDVIKASIGVQNDAEVIRFLIQHYYQENLERAADEARIEVERDREIVKRFMDKYGPEWKKLGEDT